MRRFSLTLLAFCVAAGRCQVQDEEDLLQTVAEVQEHDGLLPEEALDGEDFSEEDKEYIAKHMLELSQIMRTWGMSPVPYMAKLMLEAQSMYEDEIGEAASHMDLHATQATKYGLLKDKANSDTNEHPLATSMKMGMSDSKFQRMMRAVITVETMGLHIFDKTMSQAIKAGALLNVQGKNGTKVLFAQAQALDRNISLTDPTVVDELKAFSKTLQDTIEYWYDCWTKYGAVVDKNGDEVNEFYTKNEGSWIPFGKDIANIFFGTDMVKTIQAIWGDPFKDALKHIDNITNVSPEEQINKIMSLPKIFNKAEWNVHQFYDRIIVAEEKNETIEVLSLVKDSPLAKLLPPQIMPALYTINNKCFRVMHQVLAFTNQLNGTVAILTNTTGFSAHYIGKDAAAGVGLGLLAGLAALAAGFWHQ